MTGSVDCKDHSRSEGGQQRGEAGGAQSADNKWNDGEVASQQQKLVFRKPEDTTVLRDPSLSQWVSVTLHFQEGANKLEKEHFRRLRLIL